MIFKRLFFSFIITICSVLLLALTLLEAIPAWFVFVAAGKYLSFSDKLSERTFDYFQTKLEKNSYEASKGHGSYKA
jgi:hypothetical protein